MENEREIIEFIEAVYRRDHLRDEFQRFSSAVDDLCNGLPPEAELVLLGNIRSLLEETAAHLDVAEQTVNALLPAAARTLETRIRDDESATHELPERIDETAGSADDSPNDAGPDLSDLEDDESDEHWSEVPESDVVADTLAPDSPIASDALSWEPLPPKMGRDSATSASEAGENVGADTLGESPLAESSITEQVNIDASKIDDDGLTDSQPLEDEACGIREEDVMSLLREEGAVTAVVKRSTLEGLGNSGAEADFWGTSPVDARIRAPELEEEEDGEKDYA